MNDERKPQRDPIGHATIPPELRPFLDRTARAEEPQHRVDPVMDAAFAQIDDAIGEDVQEIDPDVGVGNASAYVGPALVRDGARGKAFTAKVKIIESGAKSDRPPVPANDATKDARAGQETTLDQAPPSSRGGMRLGGRTARLMAQAAVEHAPPVSVADRDREGVSAAGGRSRGAAIVVAIAALGVVVAVGVWIVAKTPPVVGSVPAPEVSGTASAAPAVPPARPSGEAVVPAPSAQPVGTVEVDAGTSLAPSGPTAPYKPKGSIVKPEDPYDAAAPLATPAKTIEPVAPPPPSAATAQPKPAVSSNPFDKPNYD